MFTVTPTRYGWCRFTRGDLDGAARFERADVPGGLAVAELTVAEPPGDRTIDAAARLTQALRDDATREQLLAGLAARDALTPARVEAADDAERRQPALRARWGLGEDAAAGQDAMMRRLAVDVPDDRFKPDSFYAEVADAYQEARRQDPTRPAALLAEANGVPTAVARRWVKEARRRDLLPAGRVA